MREEHGFLKDDLITWGQKLRVAREEKANALNKIAERERKKKEKEKLADEIVQIDVDIEVSLWERVVGCISFTDFYALCKFLELLCLS
jgi:hypothetical protein